MAQTERERIIALAKEMNIEVHFTTKEEAGIYVEQPNGTTKKMELEDVFPELNMLKS